MFTKFRRSARAGTPDERAMSAVLDLGAKPEATEQPDAALERERARQAAVTDAGKGIFDVPSILASEQPIPFVDHVRSWVVQQQRQAMLRAELHAHAAHGLRHLIENGKDDGARERGVGRTAWQERHAQRLADEETAAARVLEAEQTLEDHSAPKPATHNRRALVATWLRKCGLIFLAVPIEGVLIAVALELATASENPLEKWGLAGVVLFGLVTLPHLIAAALRRIRYQGEGGWLWGLVGLGAALILGLVFGIGYLRDFAAHIDLSLGGSGGGSTVVRTDQAVSGAEPMATAQPSLYWIFVVIMLVMSTVVLLSGLLSHAPEQMAYIRARRGLDRARTHSADAAQVVAEIDSRLEYQDRDIEETTTAAERYAFQVLPALGDELVEIYTTELAREMGDPAFTDALRAAAANRATASVPASAEEPGSRRKAEPATAGAATAAREERSS